jgi:hypothetical protein
MSTAALLQCSLANLLQSSNSDHSGLLLQRKCACGSPTSSLIGECEGCKRKKGLQAKLSVGVSTDPLEQEADQVAEEVLAAPPNTRVSGSQGHMQRYAGQTTGKTYAAPSGVERVLAGPGRAVDPALRQDMEQRFGYDFSQVRIHTGRAAEQSARDVNANAYTVGHKIVFGAGRFAPGTHEGRRLFAHELTHVVQQSGSYGTRTDQCNEKGGLSPGVLNANRFESGLSNGNFMGLRQETALSKTLQRKEAREIEAPELEATPEAPPRDLPKAAADPRNNSDFIDRRLTAVGVGLSGTDFILFCEGIDNPIALPLSYIDLVTATNIPVDQVIYPSREEALTHVPIGPPAPGGSSQFAYYRAIGGLVVPTTLSPASAPETVKLIAAAREKLRGLAKDVTDFLVTSVIWYVTLALARIGISRWIVRRDKLQLKKLEEAKKEALPLPKGPPVFGGSGSSGTVDLYHYGDLTGVESFESTATYPRLTNYEFGTSRSDVALRTGTPDRPTLKYKYRIRIDREHLNKEFGSRDRHPYTEYGTKKPVKIPVKYFEKVGDLKLD